MDDSGNILIKRIAKANIYVKTGTEENAVSNEILKLSGGGLELDKPVKLFDMKQFQQNVAKELKRGYPDRRKLECQVGGDYEIFWDNSFGCSAYLLLPLRRMNLKYWTSPVG